MNQILVCIGTFAMAAFVAQAATVSADAGWNQAAREESSANPNGMQNLKARRSNDVSLLLHDTRQARTALADNNRQQAAQDIAQALQADNQLGSQRMVPLFTELDQYSVIGPIEASRSAAINAPNTNPNPPEALAVKQVQGQFTSIDLDSSLAKTHLEAAQQALAQGNTQVARQALRGVEDSVVLVSVGSDLPLLRARDNLVLARMDAMHGQYEKAHLDLRAACRALTAYGNQGGAYASQAQALCSQIQSYNRTIQNNHANAASNIEGWWNQTTDWVTPAPGATAGA